MKHENEFRFILDMVCEYLQTLPEGTAKIAMASHATLCLSMIEMTLKEGMEPVEAEPEEVAL